MSVVRGRPPGLAGGMSGSIKRYWSSLRAWPDPKSPTQVRSAGVHIVASRQGKVPGAPSARHSSPVKLTSTPFQNGLSAPHKRLSTRRRRPVNNIIYIIGLIVVVLAILAFLGLR